MVNIFGLEVDLISLVAGVGAGLLALRNYFILRKGACIYPDEIVTYGIVRPVNDEQRALFFPLTFHNEGNRNGVVKKIEIGFFDGVTTKYLQIWEKVELNSLGAQGRQATYGEFIQKGYTGINPIYPIVVPAGESVSIMIECLDRKDNRVIPVDKQLTCIIKIEYGRDASNEIRFPFLLSAEDFEKTETIKWYRPKAGNLREQFPSYFKD